MSKPTNPIVLIYIGGGCLQGVTSNIAGLQVILADQDNHDENCEDGDCHCDLMAMEQDHCYPLTTVGSARALARRELING